MTKLLRRALLVSSTALIALTFVPTLGAMLPGSLAALVSDEAQARGGDDDGDDDSGSESDDSGRDSDSDRDDSDDDSSGRDRSSSDDDDDDDDDNRGRGRGRGGDDDDEMHGQVEHIEESRTSFKGKVEKQVEAVNKRKEEVQNKQNKKAKTNPNPNANTNAGVTKPAPVANKGNTDAKLNTAPAGSTPGAENGTVESKEDRENSRKRKRGKELCWKSLFKRTFLYI